MYPRPARGYGRPPGPGYFPYARGPFPPPARYGQPPHPLVEPRVSATRPPIFDQYLCENEFPRVLDGEEQLAESLLNRNQQIAPTAAEQAKLTSLITNVKTALETIATTNELPSAKIEEFKEVGSFKKGTMLSKSNEVDLVLVFKTLPTHATVKALCDKIVSILKVNHPCEVFGVVPSDFGCSIAGTAGVLRLLITIPSDMHAKLDPELHLSSDILARNMAALKHAMWFDENAGQPAIKMLVRILKDIKQRTAGLAALDVWTIELMSHYCVTFTPDRTPLPLPHALRRFFQLLSSGFLLHTSIAVTDPCDPSRRLNYGFSPSEADTICRTAQYICRLLLHEKFDRVLGLKNPHKDVAKENETEDGLNIAPLKEAYYADKMSNTVGPQFMSRISV